MDLFPIKLAYITKTSEDKQSFLEVVDIKNGEAMIIKSIPIKIQEKSIKFEVINCDTAMIIHTSHNEYKLLCLNIMTGNLVEIAQSWWAASHSHIILVNKTDNLVSANMNCISMGSIYDNVPRRIINFETDNSRKFVSLANGQSDGTQFLVHCYKDDHVYTYSDLFNTATEKTTRVIIPDIGNRNTQVCICGNITIKKSVGKQMKIEFFENIACQTEVCAAREYNRFTNISITALNSLLCLYSLESFEVIQVPEFKTIIKGKINNRQMDIRFVPISITELNRAAQTLHDLCAYLLFEIWFIISEYTQF